MNPLDKKYLSTTELAKILGVTRVTIFNMIKSGKIKAERYGRNYLIPTDSLADKCSPGKLQETEKAEIKQAIKKAVNEYGETFKLLGKE